MGVALSDPLRLLASPHGVLVRDQGLAPAIEDIAGLVEREDVREVVVGLPLNADGTEGRQAKRARRFAQIVARRVGRPVHMWDERLSTQEAESRLRASGGSTKRARQRGEVDALAAAVILQDFLDAQRRASERTTEGA